MCDRNVLVRPSSDDPVMKEFMAELTKELNRSTSMVNPRLRDIVRRAKNAGYLFEFRTEFSLEVAKCTTADHAERTGAATGKPYYM